MQALPSTQTAPTIEQFTQKIKSEFIDSSAIHPALFAATVSIHSDVETDQAGEPTTPIHSALGWQFTRFGFQVKATLFAALLLNEDGSTWQAKTSNPRKDKDGKLCKYEVPKGNGSRAFRPRIPTEIRQLISARYGVEVPLKGSFWAWLEEHPEISIIITEGAKKSLALLSLGYVAISVYGINAGYGKRGNSYKLIPDLVPFATAGREIQIAFDQDSKPSTRSKVQAAKIRFGSLFAKSKCKVYFVEWDGRLGKGIDDFIASQGADACEEVFASAESMAAHGIKKFTTLKHSIDLEVSQKDLDILDQMPRDRRLLGFLSPIGTKKTKSMGDYAHELSREGQQGLALTHRQQLGRAIADAFGWEWVDDKSEEARMFGEARCINRLLQLIEVDCEGRVVIQDEACQLLSYLLSSNLLSGFRRQLIDRFHHVLREAKQVILLDADLDDLTIEYFESVMDEKCWVCQNNWKPDETRITKFRMWDNPSSMLAEAFERIARGEKLLILVDTQKATGSKYSSYNLAKLIAKKFPNCKIARIDSTTVANPESPSNGCIKSKEDIKKFFTTHDVVIATTSIGTGVSIEVEDYFDGVYAVLNGNLAIKDVYQFMGRLRYNCDRNVYMPETGKGFVANGSASWYEIIEGRSMHVKIDLNHIKNKATAKQQSDFIIAELMNADTDAWMEDLRKNDQLNLVTYAKQAAEVNAGMYCYREGFAAFVEHKGHIVEWVDFEKEEAVEEAAKAVKTASTEETIKAICESVELNEAEYGELKGKQSLTDSERHAIERWEIENSRYLIPTTPELVEKDVKGFHSKLKLYYLSTQDSSIVEYHDRDRLNQAATDEHGKYSMPCIQDVRTYSARTQIIRNCGILELLESGLEYHMHHPKVLQIIERLNTNPKAVKEILGVTVHPVEDRKAGMQTISVILKKLGIETDRTRIRLSFDENDFCPYLALYKKDLFSNNLGGDKPVEEGDRLYVFSAFIPEDERQAIFEAWLERDMDAIQKEASFIAPVIKSAVEPVTTQETSPIPVPTQTLTRDDEFYLDMLEVAETATTPPPQRPPQPGDMVQIISGPDSGKIGILIDRDGWRIENDSFYGWVEDLSHVRLYEPIAV